MVERHLDLLWSRVSRHVRDHGLQPLALQRVVQHLGLSLLRAAHAVDGICDGSCVAPFGIALSAQALARLASLGRRIDRRLLGDLGKRLTRQRRRILVRGLGVLAVLRSPLFEAVRREALGRRPLRLRGRRAARCGFDWLGRAAPRRALRLLAAAPLARWLRERRLLGAAAIGI
eukprot:4918439-Prymnesium_polylepis.1